MDDEVRPLVVHVNLDPQLLQRLRETRYLSLEPFGVKLPAAAKELMKNTDSRKLGRMVSRLETIASKYNAVMKTISVHELPLFERKLAKIDQVAVYLFECQEILNLFASTVPKNKL